MHVYAVKTSKRLNKSKEMLMQKYELFGNRKCLIHDMPHKLSQILYVHRNLSASVNLNYMRGSHSYFSIYSV